MRLQKSWISIRKTTGWKKKKGQAMKVSEVPAGLGADICNVQHLSENDLLSKAEGLRGG